MGEPTTSVTSSDGVPLAVWELDGSGPPLVLAHATGFCGTALVPLAERLDDRLRPVVFDERGHGRSGRPADGNFEWHGFARDVLAVVDHLGAPPPLGFGHSCGAAALLLAEEQRPGTFAGLYLFEPVVNPTDQPPPPLATSNPLAAAALRRRTTFASFDEAFTNFASKPPLDALDHRVLRHYLEDGFTVAADGSLQLRCHPADEAAVYANGFSHDAFSGLGSVRCPVVLACGGRSDVLGPDHQAKLAERLVDARVVVFDHFDHFGPLVDPQAVATSIAEQLAVPAA